MLKKDIVNQKHLTLSDRIVIENSLEKKMSFKEIGRLLFKDPTTISKEVKKHRIKKENPYYGRRHPCELVQDCTRFNVCKGRYCNVQCKTKKTCKCYTHCPFFKRLECPDLKKPPYVCNGCDRKSRCKKDKYSYKAQNSYDDYKELLSSSREGINLSKEDLNEVDALVTPLIRKGQPVAHIFGKYGDRLPFTSRTLYNYISGDMLRVKNIDLPRKVKYKPRKKGQQTRQFIDRKYRIGHTYKDFMDYLMEHPESNVVEMDCVVGPKSGKSLLTMLFRNSSLMLALLMPDTKQKSVADVFDLLKSSLGSTLFKEVFPVFLTDNGSEFMDWTNYLCDVNGEILSEIFFCDPNASYQKGRLEKNHEFIRYIVPKGRMFTPYSQIDITLIANHINSTARASLNGNTPFELAQLLLPRKVFEVLGLQPVEPQNVLLKPSLLKH
jgi:transposase, IS30 family